MALRFIQRDFLGLKEEMIAFMKERLGNNWNDQSESDNIISLIELLAYLGENVHFAIDNQKREADLVTANFPRNIYANAIRSGYKPHLYSAGTTFLRVDIQDKETLEYKSFPVDVIIPKYTEIRAQNGLVCITNEEQVLKAGLSHHSLKVYAGYYANEKFNRTNISKFNYIPLETTNIAEGTTTLEYGGELWTFVEDVYTDFKTQKIYSIQPLFLRTDIVNTIQLPFNWNNFINDDNIITLHFIKTTGAQSNYPAGNFDSYALSDTEHSTNLVTFDDTIYDSLGNDISVSYSDLDVVFTQTKDFVNGSFYESIESIRKNFVNSFRKVNALCTLEDYQAFVKMNFPDNSVVADWNYNPNENITITYPLLSKAIWSLPSEKNNNNIYYTKSLPTDETEWYWKRPLNEENMKYPLTETRKIEANEIVIFMTIIADMTRFFDYANEQWYIDWIRQSRTVLRSDTDREVKSGVFFPIDALNYFGLNQEISVFDRYKYNSFINYKYFRYYYYKYTLGGNYKFVDGEYVKVSDGTGQFSKIQDLYIKNPEIYSTLDNAYSAMAFYRSIDGTETHIIFNYEDSTVFFDRDRTWYFFVNTRTPQEEFEWETKRNSYNTWKNKITAIFLKKEPAPAINTTNSETINDKILSIEFDFGTDSAVSFNNSEIRDTFEIFDNKYVNKELKTVSGMLSYNSDEILETIYEKTDFTANDYVLENLVEDLSKKDLKPRMLPSLVFKKYSLTEDLETEFEDDGITPKFSTEYLNLEYYANVKTELDDFNITRLQNSSFVSQYKFFNNDTDLENVFLIENGVERTLDYIQNKFSSFTNTSNVNKDSYLWNGVYYKNSVDEEHKIYVNNSALLHKEIVNCFTKKLMLIILGYLNKKGTLTPNSEYVDVKAKFMNLSFTEIQNGIKYILSAKVQISYNTENYDVIHGMQYAYSPIENKRNEQALEVTTNAGGNNPGLAYFPWDVVYPEIKEMYVKLREKQGRGDKITILPFINVEQPISAHIFIKPSVSDVSSVFTNIYTALTDTWNTNSPITRTIYASEIISIMQGADENIERICVPDDIPFKGKYIINELETDDDIDITEENYDRFLEFSPKVSIVPNTNLGNVNVFGLITIRLQKVNSYQVDEFAQNPQEPTRIRHALLRQPRE